MIIIVSFIILSFLSVFTVLVTTYVDAIRNGAVPCVENAIKSLALVENKKAVDAALQLYNNEMGHNINHTDDIFHYRPRNWPAHHNCCYCYSDQHSCCCCYSWWCCHSGCCCCCCLNCRSGCKTCYLDAIRSRPCSANQGKGINSNSKIVVFNNRISVMNRQAATYM